MSAEIREQVKLERIEEAKVRIIADLEERETSGREHRIGPTHDELRDGLDGENAILCKALRQLVANGQILQVKDGRKLRHYTVKDDSESRNIPSRPPPIPPYLRTSTSGDSKADEDGRTDEIERGDSNGSGERGEDE